MEEVEVLYRPVIWEAAEGFSNVDASDDNVCERGCFHLGTGENYERAVFNSWQHTLWVECIHRCF